MLFCSGYLPPEFINNQVISQEYDIFSLGVIIAQIIIGITGYFDIVDMGAQELIDYVRILVLESYLKLFIVATWHHTMFHPLPKKMHSHVSRS